jgi:hypothetical protein
MYFHVTVTVRFNALFLVDLDVEVSFFLVEMATIQVFCPNVVAIECRDLII